MLFLAYTKHFGIKSIKDMTYPPKTEDQRRICHIPLGTTGTP